MQMRFPGLAMVAGAAAVSGALTGCPDAELAPLTPCTVSGVVREVTQNAVDKVDVLFVVDNSRSMEQEQQQLAEQLPRMAQILASGDLNGDGEQDFPPVKDMHLGVVSTDMGSAGWDYDKCVALGDDGVLQNAVANVPECAGVSVNAPFLTFQEGDDPQTLGQTFGCITRLGLEGCALEQQLEAALKAVTPSDAQTPRFYGGTPGNAGPTGPNSGFIRQDAVLAVILVTDEDDCSVPDENGELFAPSGTGAFAGTPINLRCAAHEELLYPPERYYNGLVALKPQNPELVIFAAITGIPIKFIGQDPTAEEILADPQMAYVPVPNATDQAAVPQESCRFGDPNDPQLAYPPRRIVKTVAQFGDNGTVQSICQDDFSAALDNIIAKISDQLKGACLPRELVRTESGTVSCDIVELIYDENGAQGDALCSTAGRTPDGFTTVEDEMTGVEVRYQRCIVNQVAVEGDLEACRENPEACLTIDQMSDIPTLDGWYYDDFSAEVLDSCVDTPQRITFTANAAPRQGANLRIECLQPVLAFPEQPRGRDAAGLPCDDEEGKALCTAASTKEYTTVCDSTTNTCQIQCEQQIHCPNGWQCAEKLGLCIDPTCPAIEF